MNYNNTTNYCDAYDRKKGTGTIITTNYLNKKKSNITKLYKHTYNILKDGKNTLRIRIFPIPHRQNSNIIYH